MTGSIAVDTTKDARLEDEQGWIVSLISFIDTMIFLSDLEGMTTRACVRKGVVGASTNRFLTL